MKYFLICFVDGVAEQGDPEREDHGHVDASSKSRNFPGKRNRPEVFGRSGKPEEEKTGSG